MSNGPEGFLAVVLARGAMGFPGGADQAGWRRARRVLLVPRALAVLLAVVFAGAGVAVLVTYGPTGASSAADLAAGPDGAVHGAGRVVQAWLEGYPSTTHLRLAGAPAMDVVVQGDELGGLPPGQFVEFNGEKTGSALTLYSIQPIRDPAAVSVPYFAVAAGLAAAWMVAGALQTPPGKRSALARLGAAIPRRTNEREWRDASKAEGRADNHSGAPAPKP